MAGKSTGDGGISSVVTDVLLPLLLTYEWVTVERLPVSVHEDRDNGLHGITSRDCGLLAGVDVILPLPEALSMVMAETKVSWLVSTVVAEAGQNITLSCGVTTSDGTVDELSNSEEDSGRRKCSLQQRMDSTMASEVETNVELGPGVSSDSAVDLENTVEESMVDSEHVVISEFDFEHASGVLLEINA